MGRTSHNEKISLMIVKEDLAIIKNLGDDKTNVADWITNFFWRTSEHNHRYNCLNFLFFQ